MAVASYDQEPPLHRAILLDDEQSFRLLVKQTQLHSAKNQLGFTALELARYLGKYSYALQLQPHAQRQIKVLRRGTSQIKLMDELEFKHFFFVEYRSHLLFPSYQAFQKTLKAVPWTLSQSWFGRENRALGCEFQPQLFSGEVADLLIRWVNNLLGYGLFANGDLPRGSYVGEFTGLVRRLSRRHPDHNAYCFHYPTRFFSWRYTLIDALPGGNETRFINHSDTPNLQPLCLCERDLLHIIFVAKVDIAAGTQLTYDYGNDFWLKRSKLAI
jgi:hypothetical protein